MVSFFDVNNTLKYGKVLRILKKWMYYCEDLVRSCEYLNFPAPFVLNDILQENKNSNSHNFLPDIHNNLKEILNQRRLYLVISLVSFGGHSTTTRTEFCHFLTPTPLPSNKLGELRGHSTTKWTEFCHFLTKTFLPSNW